MRGIRQMILPVILSSTPGPVYCSRCGAANQAGSTYCVGCGAMLSP